MATPTPASVARSVLADPWVDEARTAGTTTLDLETMLITAIERYRRAVDAERPDVGDILTAYDEFDGDDVSTFVDNWNARLRLA